MGNKTKSGRDPGRASQDPGGSRSRATDKWRTRGKIFYLKDCLRHVALERARPNCYNCLKFDRCTERQHRTGTHKMRAICWTYEPETDEAEILRRELLVELVGPLKHLRRFFKDTEKHRWPRIHAKIRSIVKETLDE